MPRRAPAAAALGLLSCLVTACPPGGPAPASTRASVEALPEGIPAASVRALVGRWQEAGELEARTAHLEALAAERPTDEGVLAPLAEIRLFLRPDRVRAAALYGALVFLDPADRVYPQRLATLRGPGEGSGPPVGTGPVAPEIEVDPEAAFRAARQDDCRDAAVVHLLRTWQADGSLEGRLPGLLEEAGRRPDDTWTLWLAAQAHWEAGDGVAAAPLFETLSRLLPDSLVPYQRLKEWYEKVDDVDALLRVCVEVAERFHFGRTLYYNTIALCYTRKGDVESALRWRSRDLKDENPTAFGQLAFGVECRGHGVYDLAVEHLELGRRLAWSPADRDPCTLELAETYLMMEKKEEARRLGEEILASEGASESSRTRARLILERAR